MKKIMLFIMGVILVISIFILGAKTNDTQIYKEEKVVIKKDNTLSMMLETEAESGEYSLETRSSWPTKDDGYVFNSNLSKCENGSKLSWNEEDNVVLFEGTSIDKCYVYFDVYIEPSYLAFCNDSTLACYVAKQYNEIQGNNNIYYHNSYLKNGAGDNSYRYSGSSSSVNNYVCFGSDEETCPHDNLYRIIGVFDDRVRLIKADYATSDMLGTDTEDYYGTCNNGSYYQGESSNLTNIVEYYWIFKNYTTSYWASGYYNDWSYSELNKTHLNKNYISYLDNINTKWANMIDTTTWKVGGNINENMMYSNAKTVYNSEIISPSTQITSTYKSKIGLMYVSDYGFAASPSAWTTTLFHYGGNGTGGNKITEENWMYMGISEWTISRSSYYNYAAYGISSPGHIYSASVSEDTYAVRPVFHLLSSITYVSGDGTKESPIRIK